MLKKLFTVFLVLIFLVLSTLLLIFTRPIAIKKLKIEIS